MSTFTRLALEPGEKTPEVHVRRISQAGIAWVDVATLTIQSGHADLLEALGDALHLAARGLREMQETTDPELQPIGAAVMEP